MAVDLAINNASVNPTGVQASSLDLDDFIAALPIAAGQVASTMGFGMGEEVDIFSTPPLVEDVEGSAEDQERVVAYRTAVEALTAVVFEMQKQAKAQSGDASFDSDKMLESLADDLADGEIDGVADGQAIPALAGEALEVLDVDPAELPIPNVFKNGEPVKVNEVSQLLADETEATGAEANTAALVNIVPRVELVVKNPDIDGDGRLNSSDAFPEDPTERDDSDHDGIGNNADTDDDDDGIEDSKDDFPLDPNEYLDSDGDGTGNNADTDDDGDGVDDQNDDFPLDSSRSNMTDQDGDNWPAGIDPDDQNAAIPGIAWVDTDHDGIPDDGIAASDEDDDNDGVPDVDDDFPLDAKEFRDSDGDGVGDHADTDDDGDQVPDSEDVFPLNPEESSDFDRDGKGDNADTDDDNDGLTDIEENELGSAPRDRDSDDDGRVDGKDEFPADSEEWEDRDKDGKGDNADTDDDNDGVADEKELLEGTNPYEKDTDNDGTDDADDAFPRNAEEHADADQDGHGDNADEDDDNDGVSDKDEIENGSNPLKGDSDDDGVPDSSDLFPTDPTETTDHDADGKGDNIDEDDDNDGVSDSDEALNGTNPLDPDTDHDGSLDGEDIFPKNPEEHADNDKDGIGDNEDAFDENPEESHDADGDGVGDNEDAFDNDPDESHDTDGDGVGDVSDNCRLTANPDQLDANTDGLGDACEVTPSTADMHGVWKYTLTQGSETSTENGSCQSDDDSSENGSENSESDNEQTGYLSIAQEGNAIDIQPVEVGIILSGTVTGSQFVFSGEAFNMNLLDDEANDETIEGLQGVFTAAEGDSPASFSTTLQISDDQCVQTNSLVAERVYQHTGDEDYSHVYQAEISHRSESMMIDSETDEPVHSGSYEEKQAFNIEVVQQGNQLDLFSGEGYFQTTHIDPQTGRFNVVVEEPMDETDSTLKGEYFELEGLFIGSPESVGGPVLVWSETSEEYDFGNFSSTEPTSDNASEDQGQTPFGENEFRMEFSESKGYARPVETSAFTRFISTPAGNRVKVGLLNPMMRTTGPDDQLRLEVTGANGVLCEVPYKGEKPGFKEINNLEEPQAFGEFRPGAYSSISCDITNGGASTVVAGENYSVRIMSDTHADATTGTSVDSLEVYTTSEIAPTPEYPTDLLSDVKWDAVSLPTPDASVTETSAVPLPGMYDLSSGLDLSWSAPTDITNFTKYQVRIQQYDNDIVREVRKDTLETGASLEVNEFRDENPVTVTVRSQYDSDNARYFGVSHAWQISSGVNGLMSVYLPNETIELEVHGDAWNLHHCHLKNSDTYTGCEPQGMNLSEKVLQLKLFDTTGNFQYVDVEFISATSGVMRMSTEDGSGEFMGDMIITEFGNYTPITPTDPVDPNDPINPIERLDFVGDFVDMSTVVTEGVFWAEEDYRDDSTDDPDSQTEPAFPDLEYGSFQMGASGETISDEFIWNESSTSWVADDETRTEVLLGANGWQSVTLEEVVTNASASSIDIGMQDASGVSYGSMTVMGEAMDVSGKPMASTLPHAWQSKVADAVFPAGSVVYRLQMSAGEDNYRLDCWEGQCYPAQVGYDETSQTSIHASTLDEMLVPMPAAGTTEVLDFSKGQHLMHYEDGTQLTMMIEGEAGDLGGVVNIYEVDYSSSLAPVVKSQVDWSRVTVNGVEMIKVYLSDELMSDDMHSPTIIFSVYDDGSGAKVIRGSVETSGTNESDEEFNFNPTALDAILNAANMPRN